MPPTTWRVPCPPTPIHPITMRLLGAVAPSRPSALEGTMAGNAIAPAAKRVAFPKKDRRESWCLPVHVGLLEFTDSDFNLGGIGVQLSRVHPDMVWSFARGRLFSRPLRQVFSMLGVQERRCRAMARVHSYLDAPGSITSFTSAGH